MVYVLYLDQVHKPPALVLVCFPGFYSWSLFLVLFHDFVTGAFPGPSPVSCSGPSPGPWSGPCPGPCTVPCTGSCPGHFPSFIVLVIVLVFVLV